MLLPTYKFLYIKAGDGKTGTSGDGLEAMWTSNFNLIKSLLSTLDEETEKRIVSNDIQSIKVEDGIAYFTTDNGETWVSLGPSFSNITGKVEDCEALVNKFNQYTPISSFNNLSTKVSVAESNISAIQDTLVIIRSDVDALDEAVNNATDGILVRLSKVEVSDAEKISSATIIEMREKEDGLIEYTTDGITWYPVASVTGIDWGQIQGDIDNQADLMNRFDIVNDTIDALKKTINSLEGGIDNSIKAMTEYEYNELETKDSNTVYVIIDKYQ